VTEFKFDRNASAVALLPQINVSSTLGNTIERTTAVQDNVGFPVIVKRKTSGNMADGFGAGVEFSIQDDTATGFISNISAIRSGADNSGRLSFQTANAGTTTEKMTIMPNGNVGIGTTSPESKLEVNGAIRVKTGSDGGGIFHNYTTASVDSRSWLSRNDAVVYGDFSINQSSTQTGDPFSGTSRLYISPTGNVGIETTSPSQKLDVAGDLRVNNIYLADRIYHDGDSNTYINMVAADDFQIVVGGRQMLRMDEGTDPDILTLVDSDTATKVSVGSPTDTSSKLNVQGNISADGALKIGNNAATMSYDSTSKSIKFVFA
jgi:hypothetical protein